MAKKLLADANIQVTIYDAYENQELAKKLGIFKAPTLLVPQVDGTYKTYGNVSLIKGWIESRK